MCIFSGIGRELGAEEKRSAVKELVWRCKSDGLCVEVTTWEGDESDIMRSSDRELLVFEAAAEGETALCSSLSLYQHK
ncbi:hypothetical protein Taro_032048 [Colocasia esculenta]|uniref:Uncharacterized protein n=1 Tax=Colocasia esculenta TaxID=4460 RepID=A0A843VW91_COLES|nr:hypothetical protein [Colocasia esculenta]